MARTSELNTFVAAGGSSGSNRARAIVLLSLLAAGLAWAADAAPTMRAAPAAAPVTVQAGDLVVVTGTKFDCSVSSAAGNPTTIVCGTGTLAGPTPGTYGFAIADTAALVLKTSAAGQPGVEVRKQEPANPAAQFQRSARATAESVHLGVGRVFIVGGTHVLCAVTKQSGGPSVTCGVASSSGAFVVGSYAAVIAKGLVVLSQLKPHDEIKTIAVRKQPAGK